MDMSFCDHCQGQRFDRAQVLRALRAARELDAFCSAVDVAVGVNVVAGEGGAFPGTRIRAAAEAAGFKLEPDGVFHYRDQNRRSLFTLDNHEPAPFLPEQVKSLSTRGITLMLDVPRVSEGVAVLAGFLRYRLGSERISIPRDSLYTSATVFLTGAAFLGVALTVFFFRWLDLDFDYFERFLLAFTLCSAFIHCHSKLVRLYRLTTIEVASQLRRSVSKLPPHIRAPD